MKNQRLEDDQEICIELVEEGRVLILTKLLDRKGVDIKYVAESMGKLSQFCFKKNIALKLCCDDAAGDLQKAIFEAMRWSLKKSVEEMKQQ